MTFYDSRMMLHWLSVFTVQIGQLMSIYQKEHFVSPDPVLDFYLYYFIACTATFKCYIKLHF